MLGSWDFGNVVLLLRFYLGHLLFVVGVSFTNFIRPVQYLLNAKANQEPKKPISKVVEKRSSISRQGHCRFHIAPYVDFGIHNYLLFEVNKKSTHNSGTPIIKKMRAHELCVLLHTKFRKFILSYAGLSSLDIRQRRHRKGRGDPALVSTRYMSKSDRGISLPFGDTRSSNRINSCHDREAFMRTVV